MLRSGLADPSQRGHNYSQLILVSLMTGCQQPLLALDTREYIMLVEYIPYTDICMHNGINGKYAIFNMDAWL